MCEWAKEEGLRIPPDGGVKSDVGKCVLTGGPTAAWYPPGVN